MSLMPDPRFELKRITDSDWLILDHRYGELDARRNVACVYELAPSEVEVAWMRSLPLARFYTDAAEALEDVERFHRRARATRRHLAPARSAALANA